MKKQHLQVIREIQESIPTDLIKNLTVKEKQFSTLKEVCERGLKEPDDKVTPREKRRLQAMLDSGYLEKEVDVINKPVEKQIDEYMTRELARAVKEGRLPKKAPQLKLKSKINKGKQYARRQHARLAALFNKPIDEVASEEKGS
jgi:hypothetical protein